MNARGALGWMLIIAIIVALTLIVVYAQALKNDQAERRGSIWRTPAPARPVKPSNIRGLIEWYFRNIRYPTAIPLPSETPWPTLTPLPYPEATVMVEAYP